MVNLTLNEVRVIAGRRGIKNYKNMPRKTLLSTLNKADRDFNTISENKLEQITEMQNLSHYELQ